MEVQEAQHPTSLAFEEAFHEFKSDPATEKLLEGDYLSSPAELRLTIKNIEEKQGSRKLILGLRRLKPLIEGLEKYSKIVEVFVNVKPDILAFIWGPIKTCLLVRLKNSHSYRKD